MFENWRNSFQNDSVLDGRNSHDIYTRQYNTALDQFRMTLVKGKIFRLMRRVLDKPQWLYDLNDLKKLLSLQGSCYAGIQVVPISSIIGSEGRTADFDMEFHPTSEASRERWVGMAMAYLARLPLPPLS